MTANWSAFSIFQWQRANWT